MFCWELLHHCIRSAFKNVFQTSSPRADGSVEAKFSESAQQKFAPALLQGLHDRNVSLCHNRLRDGWVSTLACNATLPLSAAALCGDCAGWSPRSLELTRSRRSSCVSLPADQSAPAAHRCHAQTMKSVLKTAPPSSWVAFLLEFTCSECYQELSLFQCRLTFQKSCLFQLAGQEMSLTWNCQSSGLPWFIVYLLYRPAVAGCHCVPRIIELSSVAFRKQKSLSTRFHLDFLLSSHFKLSSWWSTRRDFMSNNLECYLSYNIVCSALKSPSDLWLFIQECHLFPRTANYGTSHFCYYFDLRTSHYCASICDAVLLPWIK